MACFQQWSILFIQRLDDGLTKGGYRNAFQLDAGKDPPRFGSVAATT